MKLQFKETAKTNVHICSDVTCICSYQRRLQSHNGLDRRHIGRSAVFFVGDSLICGSIGRNRNQRFPQIFHRHSTQNYVR